LCTGSAKDGIGDLFSEGGLELGGPGIRGLLLSGKQ